MRQAVLLLLGAFFIYQAAMEHNWVVGAIGCFVAGWAFFGPT